MAVDLGYDESGDHGTLLVSMQLGVTHQAKKLKKIWKTELEKVGIPYFHSKDFKNYSSGVFLGLDREERERLLTKLSELIRNRLEIGLTAKVGLSFYESQTTQQFRSKWGTAYNHAIAMLLLGARAYLEKANLGFDVNILIEDGHRNVEQALQSLTGLKNSPDPIVRILNLGLGSKKDHPILQSADMLAHSEWQNLTQGTMEIYDALHVEGVPYQPEIFDCDEELVQVQVKGVSEYEAARKAWGRSKTIVE